MNNMTKAAYYNMIRQQDNKGVVRENEMQPLTRSVQRQGQRQVNPQNVMPNIDPNSLVRANEMQQMQQTPPDVNSVMRENEMSKQDLIAQMLMQQGQR
jgi:hypothetical protein|tara:strand:+ start:122 stop:415 length:294 start_codon:yes stop_codon:yes gene_type:complete